MAIVVNSGPGSFASAHSNLWHIASSDSSSQPGFKYVFDLKVNGSIIASLRNYPDNGGYGVVDVAPIIRNYANKLFASSGSNILQNSGDLMSITYTIEFGEDYGGVTYTGLQSRTYTAYNYVQDIFGNTISSYANKFLTTRDRVNAEVMNGEKFYISFFNPDANSITATIQKLKENGTNDGDPYTGSAISSAKGLLLDLSPFAINSYVGSNFITGSTYKYKVTIGGDSIILKQVCAPRFTPVQIVFLNRLGGYDSFVFRLLSKNRKQFTRSTYNTQEFVRSGTSMINKVGNVHFGGSQAFATTIDQSMRVVSDYLSVQDYNLGAELIGSNDVYLYKIDNGNDHYFPIVFSETSWEEKNNTSDRMFNYELSFNLGISQFSQYK